VRAVCLGGVQLEQVEGVATPADDLPEHHDRLQVADQMLEVMPDKPEIIHTLTSTPAYSRAWTA